MNPKNARCLRQLLTIAGAPGTVPATGQPIGAMFLSAGDEGTGTIDVGGTWTGSLSFYAQTKQPQPLLAANFVALPVMPLAGGPFVTSVTGNGVWMFSVPACVAIWVVANPINGSGADVQINLAPAASVMPSISVSGTTPPASVTGSLALANAAVVLPISGAQWATARFSFTGLLPSQTFEFDTTSDGVNWIASGQGAAYVRRIDAVSANPSVVFGSTATVGGNSLSFNINTYGASTWELPLAGNVQAVRLLPLSVGAGTVTISAGLPYAPGVPVLATLFDVTSATNTAINSGALDISGWSYASVLFTATGGTPSFSTNNIDDTGASVLSIIASTSSPTIGILSRNGALATALSSATASLYPKRTVIFSGAISGQTTRVRSEVGR